MASILIATALGCLWLGAAGLLVVQSERTVHRAATGITALAAILTLALLPLSTSEPVTWLHLGDAFGPLTFVPDGMGAALSALAAVIGCLTVAFSNDYMAWKPQLRRYYALMLLFIGAMIGLVLTDSLLMLFLFWELTAFCSYALIAFDCDDPKAVAGGVRALVVTQIGGMGLLLGALAVYGYTGSYSINGLISAPDALTEGVLALLAFGMLAAAAAKSAQVPFHTWLPGAMEAPSPVSALIHAATMVNAGVYLLARLYPAFESVPGWTDAVIVVGLLSILVAGLLAVSATDLKRALAYSTISQLGFMVYAVGVGDLLASQFHLMSHAVFKALLFLAAGAVIHSLGTRDMREMGGVGHVMPFTRNVFLVGALGLAGLPIFNGFWSKELILESGVHGPSWAYLLALLGVGMTALYTMRMVRMVFFGPARQADVHRAGLMMRVTTGLLAVGTLLTGFLIEPFSRLLHDTLPLYGIHVHATGDMISDVLGAPGAYVALLVVAIGGALWFLPPRLSAWLRHVEPRRLLTNDLGFAWINRATIGGLTGASDALGRTQTGLVNWNVVAIVAALLVVLIWSAGGLS